MFRLFSSNIYCFICFSKNDKRKIENFRLQHSQIPNSHFIEIGIGNWYWVLGTWVWVLGTGIWTYANTKHIQITREHELTLKYFGLSHFLCCIFKRLVLLFVKIPRMKSVSVRLILTQLDLALLLYIKLHVSLSTMLYIYMLQ